MHILGVSAEFSDKWKHFGGLNFFLSWYFDIFFPILAKFYQNFICKSIIFTLVKDFYDPAEDHFDSGS